MTRPGKLIGLTLALVVLLSTGACAGASVSVYGTGYYGPGAWGGYPYPGRYPPRGGGVFVGVCCDDDEQQQDQDQDQDPQDEDGAEPLSGASQDNAGGSTEPKSPGGF
jgi:hypothetical protein